jgi:HflC protein
MSAKTKIGLAIGAVLLVLVLLGGAVFVVSETNQVVITQFGDPIGGTVSRPGLHLKMPFIQKANYFEKRWLAWDGDPNQIPTKDKKYIWVDTYCRWRISDPLVFFQRVSDERNAHSRLDDIVDGETRNVIAKFDLIEIVRSSKSPRTPLFWTSPKSPIKSRRAAKKWLRSSSKTPPRSRPNSESSSRTSRSCGSITSTKFRKKSSTG